MSFSRCYGEYRSKRWSLMSIPRQTCSPITCFVGPCLALNEARAFSLRLQSINHANEQHLVYDSEIALHKPTLQSLHPSYEGVSVLQLHRILSEAPCLGVLHTCDAFSHRRPFESGARGGV